MVGYIPSKIICLLNVSPFYVYVLLIHVKYACSYMGRHTCTICDYMGKPDVDAGNLLRWLLYSVSRSNLKFTDRIRLACSMSSFQVSTS